MTRVDLAYDDRGNGTEVVLLHAFPTNRTLWAAVADELASEALRIVTPDLRGFGGSPLGDDSPSLDVVADDVIGLLDQLGIERAVIGGVSLGGYVTLNLLRRHPERVMALVLVDTKAAADDIAGKSRRETMAVTVLSDGNNDVYTDGWVNTLVGATTRQWRAGAVAQVRTWAVETSVETVAWYQRAMAARPDSFADLAATQMPALIVVGSEDEITPVTDAEAMRQALRRATLSVLASSGHLSPLEVPADVALVLREFLAQ
jgi:pimeloyl-ACP methyl ester carboxylesterase